MKKPVMLPPAAREHMSDVAREQLADNVPHLDVGETYTTVAYEGVNGEDQVSGLFVEVAPNLWVENNTFRFEEVSETPYGVVLFDASRETTIEIDYRTGDLGVIWPEGDLTWTVTDVSRSLAPVIPDGWDV